MCICYCCTADAQGQPNQWIAFFTSTENRHALPLFTSLLNIVCAYDPIGYGLPYNHLMFNDAREPLVEIALQVHVAVDITFAFESVTIHACMCFNAAKKIYRRCRVT